MPYLDTNLKEITLKNQIYLKYLSATQKVLLALLLSLIYL